MIIEQEKLIAFFDILDDVNERKKDVAKELKETIEGFSEENNISKKKLKDAYKSFKAWQKDRSKFNEEERTYNELLDIATGELCVKGEQ